MTGNEEYGLPPLPGSGSGWGRARITFLSVSALLLVLLLWWASDVLLPFILAVLVAFVLTPAVAWCERRKISRGLAIILVYSATLLVAYLGFATIAPRIYAEAVAISREAPSMARELATKWGPPLEKRLNAILERTEQLSEPDTTPSAGAVIKDRAGGGYTVELGSGFDVVQEGPQRWRVTAHEEPTSFSVSKLVSDGIDSTFKFAKRNALELIRVGHSVLSKISRGVFLGVMILMVAGYLMLTRETVLEFFRSLVPPRASADFDRLLWRIDRGLSGVVRGQLLICLVNGVLSAIGFVIFDLKYWPILAILAGVMSIVPIFGSILSTIPAVLVALTQDVWTALWVLLWILGIHQLEANLLNPKIIGDAAKLHPVLVVFALLLGEHSFGIWGALLAVPVLSIAQSLFNHFRFLAMPNSAKDSLVPPASRG
jgi:predicted PurR-regulated permease PerM